MKINEVILIEADKIDIPAVERKAKAKLTPTTEPWKTTSDEIPRSNKNHKRAPRMNPALDAVALKTQRAGRKTKRAVGQAVNTATKNVATGVATGTADVWNAHDGPADKLRKASDTLSNVADTIQIATNPHDISRFVQQIDLEKKKEYQAKTERAKKASKIIANQLQKTAPNGLPYEMLKNYITTKFINSQPYQVQEYIKTNIDKLLTRTLANVKSAAPTAQRPAFQNAPTQPQQQAAPQQNTAAQQAADTRSTKQAAAAELARTQMGIKENTLLEVDAQNFVVPSASYDTVLSAISAAILNAEKTIDLNGSAITNKEIKIDNTSVPGNVFFVYRNNRYYVDNTTTPGVNIWKIYNEENKDGAGNHDETADQPENDPKLQSALNQRLAHAALRGEIPR